MAVFMNQLLLLVAAGLLAVTSSVESSLGGNPSTAESHGNVITGSSIIDHINQQQQDANEFVTAYPKNGQFAALSTIRLHVTTTDSRGPVSFTVSNPSMSTFTGSVSIGQSVTIPIHYTLTVTSINDINKAIYIKAEGNKTVRVYSSNYVATSAGAFTVLPLHEYDTIDTYTYFIISTDTQINNRYSTAVLVSGTQATNVTITPTRPITLPPAITGLPNNIIVPANAIFTFTMSPFQTVLIENIRDITGTKIESTLPIAVIAGHQCGMVPTNLQYCDHLVHQIPPTNTWGFNYMSLPFPSGSIYRMIPSADNTSIIITCGNGTGDRNVTSLGPLASGDWVEHTVSNNTWCSIVSNGPILVVQLAKGGQQRQIGDPMSLVLTSMEQYTTLSSSLVIPQSLYQTNLDQIININAQIFVQASTNLSGLEIYLDNTPTTLNWTSIYSGDILTGYATKVTGLSNSPHLISSSSNSTLMGISIFGYSNNDAYSYPLNGGLNSVSNLSPPLQVTFPQTNYTLIEGANHTIPITRHSMLGERISLEIKGCSGTSLPSNLIMRETLIDFAPGEDSGYIELSVQDDTELSSEECFCVELVRPGFVYTFLRPYSMTTMCIRDNEDVRVQITSAIVNEDMSLIDVTLSLVGYQGNTDMMIMVQPVILLDQQEQGQQVPLLSLFNVYFTKYLTTLTYSLTLTDTIPSDSLLLINSMDTRLNITTEPIHITFPPTSPPPLPSSTTSIPVIASPSLIISSSDIISSSYISSTSTSTLISTATSTVLIPTVTHTPPTTANLSFFSNSTNVILLVLSIAAVGLLITSVAFCITTIHLIKVRKNSKSFDLNHNNQSQWKLTDVEGSITTSQMSITKRTSGDYNSYNSSESQDPNHVIDTNSPPNSTGHNSAIYDSIDQLCRSSPV